MDHEPPEPFVHDKAAPAGKVTLEPAEEAVLAVPRAVPPAE